MRIPWKKLGHNAIFAIRCLTHTWVRNLRLHAMEYGLSSPRWKAAVRGLRREGFSIVPDYLQSGEADELAQLCTNAAENWPQTNDDPYFVATAPGSLRLRHMEENSLTLDYFRRQNKLALLAACLQGRLHWPAVQYSATCDGHCNPDYIPGRADRPFGGSCHIDQWHHQLKAIFLLRDVTTTNGPLMLFPGTWRLQWRSFDTYRLKHWNKTGKAPLPADLRQLESDNFPVEFVARLSENTKPVPLTGNAGDLILLDTRTLHFASPPVSGQRHLLWLYY